MPNRTQVLTPTQLNTLARSVLEDSFPLVEVEAELSNFSRPASGHLYFTLKDANAQIRCALFKPKSNWLKFKPVDGMQVLARGRVTLYEPRGDFQLVAEHLEPAGAGALQRALEALKQKLQAEGLFAAERKRAIPRWIHRVAVITSPQGAAIHDVLTTLARRFPLIQVDLIPVPVQGNAAAALIRHALERADASARYDAILLTRGGGSLEDLWCFNDEALVRAIVACHTPTLAAIGHEVDFTLAELAADLRCATPTAAAEALSPDRREIESRLEQSASRLQTQINRHRQRFAQRLDQLQARLLAQRPQRRLQHLRERSDALQLRLTGSTQRAVLQRQLRLRAAAQRLRGQHPRRRLPQAFDRARAQRARLQAGVARFLEQRALHLAGLARALHAVSPLATVSRGYVLLEDPEHARLLRSVEDTRVGAALRARLADGEIGLRVETIHRFETVD